MARGLLSLGLPQTTGGRSGGERAGAGWPARVAVALPNVEEFAVTLFGALRAGLVAVPVNPGYPARELRHVLTDSGASVLVGTPEIVAAAGAVPHAYTLKAPVADGPPVAEPPGGDDLAVLLYTSGTAGARRAPCSPHRALLANHAQLAADRPARWSAPDDVVLLALPLFHAYGLNTGLGAVAYHGATRRAGRPFDPADALELIARHQVTVVVGVPSMYTAWAWSPRAAIGPAGVGLGAPRGLRRGAAGPRPPRRGSPRRPGSRSSGVRADRDRAGAHLHAGQPGAKAGSIGRPIPGVELRLVGADGAARRTATVPSGRRRRRLAGLARHRPGRDRGARRRTCSAATGRTARGGPDADGWWATGDVAYADADGDLFLVDRLGELILVSGFNVYPHEVELVLDGASRRWPRRRWSACPHPYTGQTVKAYVVRRGRLAGDRRRADARTAPRNLARFKCPTDDRVRDRAAALGRPARSARRAVRWRRQRCRRDRGSP